MTRKILIYFAFASCSAVVADTMRSMDQSYLFAPKEWRLREGHKYWRASKNQKRPETHLKARLLHPKLMKMMTAVNQPEDGVRYDNAKHRVNRGQNKIRKNKLREGYTSFRPAGVRNLPWTRTKYIARNKPESSQSLMKGSQDRDGQIYGNLDNLGITYGKTNERLMYGVNRKNNRIFEFINTKRRKLSSGARTNNKEETNPELENARNVDNPLPENRPPSDDMENLNSGNLVDNNQDLVEDEIGRDVEPLEDTPKSAASYPHTKESLVYGNLDNLGITYGKTNQRILYSQSRRNTVLETLLRLLDQPSNSRDSSHKKPLVVVIYRDPKRKLKPKLKLPQRFYANKITQSDNLSSEFGNKPVLWHTRRNNTHASDSEDIGSDDSSEGEFNAHNPFTVHKNRYLQNYVWNYKMTGDHMNVNPYAPRFTAYGATAPELFYSRKWWYFNQVRFVSFDERSGLARSDPAC
ncbi:uncharacterized protein LOC125241269 isoform X1 [Leguminivora glycinivorella]|uniref:uncharacterized protein LOC125241269 isoform X1 n=1 Tax=Leguminivora glycinivorella TaxID=1035111 RepID=UPI00200C3A61|nr:uncharacterized protein LOC125241269 isoform X1 [Leguminivora glycinivorella]